MLVLKILGFFSIYLLIGAFVFYLGCKYSDITEKDVGITILAWPLFLICVIIIGIGKGMSKLGSIIYAFAKRPKKEKERIKIEIDPLELKRIERDKLEKEIEELETQKGLKCLYR